MRSATGSTSRPARNGARSSSACVRATARGGWSARTRRSASWPAPTASSPTARRRRAPGAGGDRRGRGRRIRGRGERAELPVLHQRLRHDLAGRRRRLHLDAAGAPRQYGHQRRLQPHRHRGDGQCQGSARRPASPSTPTPCRAPAGTPVSRNASGGRACWAASATTAGGTTTTAGAGRSSIPPAAWNRVSSRAGRSSTWS